MIFLRRFIDVSDKFLENLSLGEVFTGFSQAKFPDMDGLIALVDWWHLTVVATMEDNDLIVGCYPNLKFEKLKLRILNKHLDYISSWRNEFQA